jgi:hypothetical protein
MIAGLGLGARDSGLARLGRTVRSVRLQPDFTVRLKADTTPERSA